MDAPFAGFQGGGAMVKWIPLAFGRNNYYCDAMISSIYTRTGDTGTTGLADGTRVPKHSLRLEAYGTVDEANANLGTALATLQEQLDDHDGLLSESSLLTPLHQLHRVLQWVSHRLFNCSSLLARGGAMVPEGLQIDASDVENLERAIDAFQEKSGSLSGFVLCGGAPLAARLHVTRTVIRRAERAVCRLYETEPGDKWVLMFINRASDFFFAAARYANFSLGTPEILWQRDVSFPSL